MVGCNGEDLAVIEPGRIRVVLIREVVPAADASPWSCTRCGQQVAPAQSFWLSYVTASSDVPFIVPVCSTCVARFDVAEQDAALWDGYATVPPGV